MRWASRLTGSTTVSSIASLMRRSRPRAIRCHANQLDQLRIAGQSWLTAGLSCSTKTRGLLGNRCNPSIPTSNTTGSSRSREDRQCECFWRSTPVWKPVRPITKEIRPPRVTMRSGSPSCRRFQGRASQSPGLSDQQRLDRTGPLPLVAATRRDGSPRQPSEPSAGVR